MPSPSLCLSTILFTLEAKEPKENEYTTMFLLWLTRLIRSAYLNESDALYLYIDTRTMSYLNRETIFPDLRAAVQCPVKVFGVPPPKTILEGMQWKFSAQDYSQDYYMYCDLDVYIMAPIRPLLERLEPETLYIEAEGTIHHDNYGADNPPEFKHVFPPDTPGFSSGKFLMTSRALRDKLFQKVLSLWKEGAKYYCVEQPFVNRAILEMYTEIEVDTGPFKTPYLMKQRADFNADTAFIDLAGEPGNGPLHLEKMLNIYMLLDAGCFRSGPSN